MNPLIKQLKKYGNLTSEIETELNEKIKSLIKQKGDFLLKEGQIVDIQQFEGKFIGILLPARVTLQIVEAEPSVKGNTADGKIDKVVKLETGLELRVPGFVGQDDSIVVSTETGEYVERAK